MSGRRWSVVTAAAFAALAMRATAGDPVAADSAAGMKLYGRHCLTCHQQDGYGVPNMQPAIKGGTWVAGDTRALALFVMTGGFDSAARKDSENTNVMPSFAQLQDEDLAAILTFIRAKFGGGASAVSAVDIAAARKSLQTPGR